MNDLIRIPCVIMRGGTSRGPFFLASDLPSDPALRDAVLMEVMGSGHPLQIDGIGGGAAVTSKVAIVRRSSQPGIDVDYLFAQVRVEERFVDTSPNCGNMLAGVAPFAMEQGLVPIDPVETTVVIRNVNTGKTIEARMPTPNGKVAYEGMAKIDGVPGTGAPITLSFLDAAGAKTGSLLPTGKASETIDGVEVTALDCAMPMVLVLASALGKTGHESARELDADQNLVKRLRAIRIEAGLRMGIDRPEEKVIPKPVLLAPPTNGGTLAVRYFMPNECHPALSATGGIGIATAIATPGTIANRLASAHGRPQGVRLEHPSGALDVSLQFPDGNARPVAGIVRTARRLFEGAAFVRQATLSPSV